MKTMIWTEEQILLEQYAERAALSVVRGANFTQCLTINGLAPAITVITSTSRPVTIHGRDLFDERAWQKFLSSQNHTSEQSRLTGTVDLLVKEYRSWLLTSYTSRYQALSTQSELAWFEQVTLLVIVRKIMEGKYAQFVREQRDAFADPWVAEEMSILMRLNTMASEIAKSIHHIVKKKEVAQPLLDQLYETHAMHLENRPRQARTPLPALPPGVALPLLRLSTRKEEQ
jgi:hypothetical protein